jgi:hypothetical protein
LPDQRIQMGYGKTHSPHPKVNPEKKPQISSLRSAPVEMTILFGNAKYRFQDELSSRPERSVVERSAVLYQVARSISAWLK